MEDYIFLIIAIVISIFGALNQNRKKKNEQELVNQAEPSDSHSDPFLNFELMDIEDEEAEYERKTREAAQEALRRAELRKSYEAKKETVFHPTRFKSTLPERKIKESLRSQQKQKQEEKTILLESEDPGILEDFSLRKAIIYSEILKPKYNS